MQGGHGYYGGSSPPQGCGYGYGGGYGYDAGGHGSAGGYPAAYVDPLAGQRAHEFPAPLDGLEIQPSEACLENYVIFDKTRTRSRVMFHPSLAHKLGGGGGGSSGHDHHHYDCYGGGGAYRDDNSSDDDDSCSVRQMEDAEEIDALLSSDQQDGGDEDDAVSTGRAPGYRPDDGSSPVSTRSSRYGGEPRPKKDRVKKMMRTLKGIIPSGGSQMGAPAVLDEAVRYLKSLKVEAKKLGVRGGGSDS